MEENIQFKRFQAIIDPKSIDIPIFKCEECPLNDKCHDEKRIDDFEHTCIEAIWHYIQTGEFLA